MEARLKAHIKPAKIKSEKSQSKSVKIKVNAKKNEDVIEGIKSGD